MRTLSPLTALSPKFMKRFIALFLFLPVLGFALSQALSNQNTAIIGLVSAVSGPPTLSSAATNSAGTTITLNWSQSCTNGSGTVAISASGGATTPTFSSGSPGSAFVYTLSRTIAFGETITVSYTQPGGGIRSTVGSVDVASFSSQPVTNNVPSATPSIGSTSWKAVGGSGLAPLTVAPTTGHTLVAVIWTYPVLALPGSTTCTDNLGGTWTKVLTIPATLAGTSGTVWVRFGIPSGITSVNPVVDSNTISSVIITHDIANVTALTGGETSSIAYNINTTNPQTGSVTNATANSIFLAFLADDLPSGTAVMTVNSTGSTPAGWALADVTHSQELDANTTIPCSVPYKIVTTSAASKHGWATDNINGTTGIICLH